MADQSLFDDDGLESSNDFGLGFDDAFGSLDTGSVSDSDFSDNDFGDFNVDNEDLGSTGGNVGNSGNSGSGGTGTGTGSKFAPFKKVLIFLVASTVTLSLVAFIALPKIKDFMDKDKNTDNKATSVSNSESDSENKSQPSKKNESTPNNEVNNTANNIVSTGNTWKSFSGSDIKFNDGYTDSIFTITDIKHYVNVATETSGIQVKSVLTGNLSGYVGTYEMELPYSKGCQLSIGKSFKVEAQVGEYGGKMVIGEIKY